MGLIFARIHAVLNSDKLSLEEKKKKMLILFSIPRVRQESWIKRKLTELRIQTIKWKSLL